MGELEGVDLRPVGGTWNGLLFENPAAGYPLSLTWTFTIEFDEVVLDNDDSESPALTIDWVPAGASSWDSMAGRTFSATTFADPIETSIYFFEHYRLDRVDLAITDQTSGELWVEASAGGDIDGLGLSQVSARTVLQFSGIYVQAVAVGTDPMAAAEQLARLTSIEGLQPRVRGHNVLFELPD